MDKDQLRELITEVLMEADLIKYEDKREVELLMLTAAVESELGKYIKQGGGGPALGIFQMEPATERDIHKNYLAYKAELDVTVGDWSTQWAGEAYELKFNLGYAIIMARIHYLRQPETIPPADDIEGLATYWKETYNTRLGKGKVSTAILKYRHYCL